MLRHSQSDTENPTSRTAPTASRRRQRRVLRRRDPRAERGGRFGHDGLALIGLVGSCDLPGVTLRRAQSILRWDRRPSLWSHAFLSSSPQDGDAAIREVALHSRSGAFPEPADNAVTPATLAHYNSRRSTPTSPCSPCA